MAENQAGPAAELSSCRYGTLEMFYTMVIFFYCPDEALDCTRYLCVFAT